jgi:hypothetical protein
MTQSGLSRTVTVCLGPLGLGKLNLELVFLKGLEGILQMDLLVQLLFPN